MSANPPASRTMAPRNKLAGLLGVLLVLAALFATAYYPAQGALAWILGGLGAAAIGHFLYRERPNLRRGAGSRGARHGANAAVITAACLGTLALLNVLAVRHNGTWDLTGDRRFTLSEQTRKVLRELEQEVKVTAFFAEGTEEQAQIKSRLEQYREQNARFRLTLVDPDRNPALARRYGIRTYGTTVFESAEQSFRTHELSEEALTNALIRVTREGKKTVRFLSGHGEHGLEDTQRGGYSAAQQALTDQGFAVGESLLLRDGAVPEGCAVLVVGGPTKPLLEPELAALRSYLNQGGQLVLLLDPGTETGLEALAAEWGAVLRPDVIVDPMSRLFGGSYTTPILTDYPAHALTRGFELATFLPLARSIELAAVAPDGIATHPLARTTPQSWGETDLNNAEASFDPTVDFKGPLTAAALLERTAGEGGTGARILLVGDSDFADNGNFRLSGNGDLLLNAVSYLAREEDLVAIRPRDTKPSPLVLTRAQGATLLYSSVVLAPLVLILSGLMIWWKRRNL
ncbi:MAG: GldG family protein [Deferrisomatales bacterium]|nr:GldG family protein [Deferrisomatales bacterium]